MIGDKYILDGQTAIKTDDLIGWLDWLDMCGPLCTVAHTKINNHTIHTRFTALDFSETETPMLFVTEVNCGGRTTAYRTYPHWSDAEIGHNEIVKLVERAIAEGTTAQSVLAKEESNGIPAGR